MDDMETDFNDVYDYDDEYGETFREILQKMVTGDKTKIVLKKIKPQMYQQALNEFIKYGKLMRFPTKYVYDWKDLVIRNTVILDVITMFYGHTSYFDTDTFNDMVFYNDEDNYVSDWSQAFEYIEEKGYDNILDEFMPTFSNGHDLISDYGLKPLAKICAELMETQNPNEIIVLINKALDVSHQRSDLSELFIEGGESSLDRISGVNENVLKIIREEINEYVNRYN